MNANGATNTTTNPSPDQIEAAKKAIRETVGLRPYAMIEDPHSAEMTVTEAMRAALVAAASVTPQEPGDEDSVDPEECPACNTPLDKCSRDNACCWDCNHAAGWVPEEPPPAAPVTPQMPRGINLLRDLGYDESDPAVIAAREAAASDAPQEPMRHEDLIAELREEATFARNQTLPDPEGYGKICHLEADEDLLDRAADALAAPVRVDEAKLSRLIEQHSCATLATEGRRIDQETICAECGWAFSIRADRTSPDQEARRKSDHVAHVVAEYLRGGGR